MTFFAPKMPFLVIFAPKMAIFHFFGHWVRYLAARALRRAEGERRGNFNRSTASIIHSGRPEWTKMAKNCTKNAPIRSFFIKNGQIQMIRIRHAISCPKIYLSHPSRFSRNAAVDRSGQKSPKLEKITLKKIPIRLFFNKKGQTQLIQVTHGTY